MLSETEAARIKVYVDTCLPILQLAHWDVRVELESADEGNDAEIVVIRDRYIAKIRIHRRELDCSAHHRRETIAHELTHMPFDRVLSHLRPIETVAGRNLYEGVYASVDSELELIADLLSRHLALALPLPGDWSDPTEDDPETAPVGGKRAKG